MGCWNHPGVILWKKTHGNQPEVLGPLVQTKLRGDLRRVLADDHAEARGWGNWWSTAILTSIDFWGWTLKMVGFPNNRALSY